MNLMVNVIEGKNLPGLDSPNKVLDAMATSLGRGVTRIRTLAGGRKGVVKAAYAKQFREAIHPGGDGDDLTTMDCVMHFLTIFWKVPMLLSCPLSPFLPLSPTSADRRFSIACPLPTGIMGCPPPCPMLSLQNPSVFCSYQRLK